MGANRKQSQSESTGKGGLTIIDFEVEEEPQQKLFTKYPTKSLRIR